MENAHKLTLNINANEDVREITTTLAMEYLNLLMFFRGQIPSPVQMLKRHVEGGKMHAVNGELGRSKQKKKSSNAQKSKQCLLQLNNIKEHIQKALGYCDLFEAVLVMGATPVSVKEVFTLKINSPIGFVSHVGRPLSKGKLQQYSSKLNSFLFEASSTFIGELRCTKNTLLIKADRKLASESFKPWENFKYLAKRHVMHLEIDLKLPPNDDFQALLPATRGLHVNSAKCNKRRSLSAVEAVELIMEEDNSSKPAEPREDNWSNLNRARRHSLPSPLLHDDRNDVTGSDDVIWFKLPISIRGFKF